jgi:enoyl-CoA hydratase/carnithine racemase
VNAEAASGDLVLYEKRGPVAWLTLNRPAALNSVNLAMRDQLWALFNAVRDDPDVRAIVLRGAGDRGFCAGADITEFGTAPSYVAARDARLQRDLWGLMLASEKPFVAAIHGWALGAGCEMSLLCDFRVASEDARFGLPEVNLGYIPSAGGTQTLPRTVPPGIALGMVLDGEPIDAASALRWGLVHRVVPRDRLYEEAETIATTLADTPRAAMRAAREALQAAADLALPQGLAVAARLRARLLAPGDGAEALRRLSNWTVAGG